MAGGGAEPADVGDRPIEGAQRARRRRLIDAALVAAVAMAILTMALLAVIGGRQRSGEWAGVDDAAVWLALVLAPGAIASVLVRRQPDNGLAPWLAIGGLLGSFAPMAGQYAALTLEVEPGSAPGGTIALLASSVGLFSAWAVLGAHVPLRFPTGSVLSPRWRWVSRLATASAVLCGLEIFHPGAFDDDEVFIDLAGVSNPIGIPGFEAGATLAFGIGILTLFLATFIAVSSLVVRYRRSRGVERDQLRWIVYSAVMMTVVTLVMANLANAFDGVWREICLAIASVMPLLLMVGIGIAVLRHQLFDIRVVIRRTLLYGFLATFITVVYVAVVVGLGRLVGAGSSEDLPLSIAATALVAVTFQPARSRLERVAKPPRLWRRRQSVRSDGRAQPPHDRGDDARRDAGRAGRRHRARPAQPSGAGAAGADGRGVFR